MRRAVPAAAAALLLAGPTILAFFSGGYFAEPRLLAAIAAWALVLALAVVGPDPVPRGLPGRLCLGGFALLTAWSAISIAWAPVGGPALASVERLVLYTGALLVACAALRQPAALRAVEPVLAAGATIVIGYGLSGRLLPDLIELDRSTSAGGRLEQPITYWNAEGALAAVGLVLCARLAGDRTRPPAIRIAAAAAAAPLGAGVYLSYSRGALAVAVLGLLVVVAAAPGLAQLRASAIALATGTAAAAIGAALPGVAALEGSNRGRDGAVALILMTVVAAAAALLTARLARSPDGPLARPRRLRHAAAALVAAAAAGLVIAGLAERSSEADLASGAQRLTTVSSNRYEYWAVGLRAFADEPITGLGAGGFRVEWLRERPYPEAVRDAHSLEVELAAELGLVGLAALALIITGAALAARRALAVDATTAAGPLAALLAWFLHVSIDWDWQLPAVTLPAIALAGALIALAEASRSGDRADSAPLVRAARSPAPTRA
jgi:O-Antigen ligase